MRVFMLSALRRAFLANLRAHPAKLLCPATSQAHQLRSIITDCSTFHIQLHTPCHHLHILLLQTGRGTMIAQRRTVQTGINTFLITVVIHNNNFPYQPKIPCHVNYSPRYRNPILIRNRHGPPLQTIMYQTFLEAHIGASDLAELWTPPAAEIWFFTEKILAHQKVTGLFCYHAIWQRDIEK
jgi:hypothetical protein